MVEMTSESNGLSRRRLLKIAGAAGLGGAAGLILPGQATAATAALVSRNYLGVTSCDLYYEPDGKARSFSFESNFYNQLSSWRSYLDSNAPTSWGAPTRVYSYGAYTDKPGMHGAGRAFDIGRIMFENSSGTRQWVSMRYDVWRGYANADYWKRRYWGTAAGLMRRFRHVLTYMDNREHWNHMHVDNDLYGELGDCKFTTSSSSQTYIVQAACHHAWGISTVVDGDWGPKTQANSTAVLRRIGRPSGTITDKANFQAFCTASYRKALGTQAY
ncbi:hypothetical protein GCM10009745_48350 [Kribbella yunnanensis]|uniref:Twin-arginine translocation signal domain-containing protein n=1 Tax=Kribbella yunnanensis TaxID=190194 RepID=A0ABN2I0J5_9ACTN